MLFYTVKWQFARHLNLFCKFFRSVTELCYWNLLKFEALSIMNFLWLKKKISKKIYELGYKHWRTSVCHTQLWRCGLSAGAVETQVETQFGMLSTLSIKLFEHLHYRILFNHQTSANGTYETLEISKEHLGFIIHKHLFM